MPIIVAQSQVRTLVARDFAAAFARCDVLLTPTSPVLPFRLVSACTIRWRCIYRTSTRLAATWRGCRGCRCRVVSSEPGDESHFRRLLIPGRRSTTREVLRVAAAYQRLTDWHTRRPTAYLANKEPA